MAIQIVHLGGSSLSTSPAAAGRWTLSRDGRWLVGGDSAHPQFYDLAAGRYPHAVLQLIYERLPLSYVEIDHGPFVACSATADCAIVANWPRDDPALGVYRLSTGQFVRQLLGHSRPPATVLLSGDGRLAVSGGIDPDIRVWDIDRGVCLAAFEHPGQPSYTLATWYEIVPNDVPRRPSLDSQPETGGSEQRDALLTGWHAVILEALGPYVVLDLATGQVLRKMYRSDVCPEQFVGVLPGDHRLLSRSGFSFWLFDTQSKGSERVFVGHRDIVTACAVHAGRGIAISGQWYGDNRLWVWDLASGEVIAQLPGHGGPIKAVTLSADGQHGLSGGDDATLRVWDLTTLQSAAVFQMPGTVSHLSTPQVNGVFCTGSGEHCYLLQLVEH